MGTYFCYLWVDTLHLSNGAHRHLKIINTLFGMLIKTSKNLLMECFCGAHELPYWKHWHLLDIHRKRLFMIAVTVMNCLMRGIVGLKQICFGGGLFVWEFVPGLAVEEAAGFLFADFVNKHGLSQIFGFAHHYTVFHHPRLM